MAKLGRQRWANWRLLTSFPGAFTRAFDRERCEPADVGELRWLWELAKTNADRRKGRADVVEIWSPGWGRGLGGRGDGDDRGLPPLPMTSMRFLSREQRQLPLAPAVDSEAHRGEQNCPAFASSVPMLCPSTLLS